MEDVEGGSERSNIAGDVGEATKTGTLEAVLGNSIAELLDGVVGDLELVAVGVEKKASRLLVLRWALVERGERGVGGRLVGRVEGRVVGVGRGSRVGGDIPLQRRLLRAAGGACCHGRQSEM